MDLVKTSRILDSYFPYDVSNIILNLLLVECEYANNEIKRMVDYYHGDQCKELSRDTLEYLHSCSYDDFVCFFETMKKVYYKSFSITMISSWTLYYHLFKNKDFILTINKLRYLRDNFDFKSEFIDLVDWEVSFEIYDYLDSKCELKDKDIPILYLYYLYQQRTFK